MTEPNIPRERVGPRPPIRTDECWFLVRTSSDKTIELADILHHDGIRAWTPRVWVRKRLPRKKARKLVLIPIFPGFIFIHQNSWQDYLDDYEKLYWFSKPQTWLGDHMRIPETEMKRIYDHDKPDKPREAEPELDKFAVGDKVKATGTPFGDLVGTVTDVLGHGEYKIEQENLFPGKMRLPHFLLERAAP